MQNRVIVQAHLVSDRKSGCPATADLSSSSRRHPDRTTRIGFTFASPGHTFVGAEGFCSRRCGTLKEENSVLSSRVLGCLLVCAIGHDQVGHDGQTSLTGKESCQDRRYLPL